MANDIAQANNTIPEHLRGETKTERFGNLDATDLVIPRIKLLSAVNPEVTKFNNAHAGQFWHTVLQESLGKELIGVPIVCRKTYVLWAPRGGGDDRGILARSRDGIHWDPPQGVFDVQYKGNQTVYKWKLAPTVAESGLDQFGSSRDDDPKSQPAATLTYEVLWWFPERPDLGQAIILNARGSVREAQRLFTVIDAKPLNSFLQKYSINSVIAKGPDNTTYFNYEYRSIGYTDEEESEKGRELFKRFKGVAFRASDEAADGDGSGAARKPHQTANRSSDSKF